MSPVPFHLKVVGTPITAADCQYAESLRDLSATLGVADRVRFLGGVTSPDSALYDDVFLHLNVSNTGNMDKTILEALACGCPVLTSNEAFRGLLSGHPEYLIWDPTPAAVAKQVVHLYKIQNGVSRAGLRALVVGKHDLESFATHVVHELSQLSRAR